MKIQKKKRKIVSFTKNQEKSQVRENDKPHYLYHILYTKKRIKNKFWFLDSSHYFQIWETSWNISKILLHTNKFDHQHRETASCIPVFSKQTNFMSHHSKCLSNT